MCDLQEAQEVRPLLLPSWRSPEACWCFRMMPTHTACTA